MTDSDPPADSGLPLNGHMLSISDSMRETHNQVSEAIFHLLLSNLHDTETQAMVMESVLAAWLRTITTDPRAVQRAMGILSAQVIERFRLAPGVRS